MMRVPVENLGLFEQLDRIVVAFLESNNLQVHMICMSVLHKNTLTRKSKR